MAAIGEEYETWEVPYLPIDPKHTGRTYEAIIRVNSQSGKGGVAYLMDAEHGLDLPKALQAEFQRTVQVVADATGAEVTPDALWDLFTATYFAPDARYQFLSCELTTRSEGTVVIAQLLVDGEHRTVRGEGNGPISAFVEALTTELGIDFQVNNYTEHALSAGSGATAVAYVEVRGADGSTWWGVGMDASILDASLRAVLSAANRAPKP
jgi:2-isopropylmalate synthase